MARKEQSKKQDSSKEQERPDIKGNVHPNSAIYHDTQGVKHVIYIPAQDYYKAHIHLVNEEQDELAKFPKYTGQGYTDADDVTNVDPKTFYSVQPPPDEEEPESNESQAAK